MKLSILIPTLPERHQQLARLVRNLQGQKTPEVEIKIHDAGRHITTGEKRNNLIRNCEGEYFVFIDDDDNVPSYYVSELLKAIEQNPDVVTFIGYMTTNGVNRKNFTIKLGSKYEERSGHYYRFCNHLCCFKKSLVEHVKFPHIYMQEDYQWAKMINDRKILKSEVHINKDMYHYAYVTKPARIRR